MAEFFEKVKINPFWAFSNGGCRTTLVESKVMERPSFGVDINPSDNMNK